MSTDPSIVSSTVRRWQLTETLRKLRDEAGLTHVQVVEQLRKGSGRWSQAKLSRIENREQGIKPHEVEQLLDIYDKTNRKLRRFLTDLAETADERGWWLAYRKDLPEKVQPYISLEVAMVAMRQFSTMLVPGLLQTQDYVRALVTAIQPELTADKVERLVAARMARQGILHRADPPQLHFILDQTMLERPIGSARIMRNQLRHLRELGEQPNITLQLLPKSLGAHVGLEGAFSILSLPDPIPDIGYTEGIGGGICLEHAEDVRRCTLRFGVLTELALSGSKSMDMISAAAEDFD